MDKDFLYAGKTGGVVAGFLSCDGIHENGHKLVTDLLGGQGVIERGLDGGMQTMNMIPLDKTRLDEHTIEVVYHTPEIIAAGHMANYAVAVASALLSKRVSNPFLRGGLKGFSALNALLPVADMLASLTVPFNDFGILASMGVEYEISFLFCMLLSSALLYHLFFHSPGKTKREKRDWAFYEKHLSRVERHLGKIGHKPSYTSIVSSFILGKRAMRIEAEKYLDREILC